MQTPSEWRQTYFSTNNNLQEKISPICVIDLGGHFAVAKPILKITESKEGEKDYEPTLLLINSTVDDYLDRPIMDEFAQLWFGQH